MSPSDLSGATAFADAVAAARAPVSTALPDAPLAMPEQRLDPARPFGALRSLFAPHGRHAAS